MILNNLKRKDKATMKDQNQDNLLNVIASLLIERNGGEAEFTREEIKLKNRELMEAGELRILVFENPAGKIIFKTVSIEQLEEGILKALRKLEMGQPITTRDEAFLYVRSGRREAIHAECYGLPN